MSDEYELDLRGVDPASKHSPEFLNELVNGTSAYPGTAEKVQVLMARYASGLPLWNDDDARRPRNSDAQVHREASPFDWFIFAESEQLSEAPEDSGED